MLAASPKTQTHKWQKTTLGRAGQLTAQGGHLKMSHESSESGILELALFCNKFGKSFTVVRMPAT